MPRRRPIGCARAWRRRKFLPLLEQLETRLLLAGDAACAPARLDFAGSAQAVVAARPEQLGPLANTAPQLDPLVLSTKVITENESVTVTGVFRDPDLTDTHRVEIHWGGGAGGQQDEGTTVITTGFQPGGTTLQRLAPFGEGRWEFTAIHQYPDDSPGETGSDAYTVSAIVTDSAGAVAESLGTSSGGNVFLTGHAVFLDDAESGFDVAVLDHLRGAGRADEIPREEYDILYVTDVNRDRLPGVDLFGTVRQDRLFNLAISQSFGLALSQADVLYLPQIWDIGGLPASGLLNTMQDEIQTFFDAGGDLFIESGAGLPTFFDFLPSGLGVTTQALSGAVDGFEFTPEGRSIGLTESLVATNAAHNAFTQFDNEFTVFETRNDQAISIGLLSAAVRVVNLAPTLDPLQLSAASVSEGSTITLNGTFSDASPLDTHSLVIDWGGLSGTTTTLTTGGPHPAGTTLVSLGGGNWSFSAEHQYLDDDPTGTDSDEYEISVSLVDDDLAAAVATVTTVVDNTAPMVDEIAVTSLQQGNDVEAKVSATFSDAGLPDTHTVVIDWGGGVLAGQPHEGTTTLTTMGPNPDGSTFTDLGDGNWQIVTSHVYRNTGSTDEDYTITVTVTDDDSGAGSSSATVSVSNVPPAIESVEFSASTVEGQEFTVTGTFSDPGLLDTHTVVIDWGGGIAGQPAEGTTTITRDGPEGTSLEPLEEGRWRFSATRVFGDDDPSGSGLDPYRLAVSVADNRGGTDRAGEDVTGGNLFLTGHSLASNNFQAGFDQVVLDFLRGAGRIDEIARSDYDIGYLTPGSGAAPGGGTFGQVSIQDPLAYSSAAQFGSFLSEVDVLYVPSLGVLGGPARSNAVNAFADEISAFYAAGGDLLVEAGGELASFYDFLPAGLPVVVEAMTGENGLEVTSDGGAVGVSDEMIRGFSVHNRFTGLPDSFVVFESREEDAISVGFYSAASTGGFPLTVVNADPVLESFSSDAETVDADGALTVSGTFYDVGLEDTHSVVIDWGDAVTRPADETLTTITMEGPNPLGAELTDLGGGRWSFSASHQFVYAPATPDSYTITATVSDDDLGMGTVSSTVLVNNVPPELAPLTITSTDIHEGDVVTVSGSFSDRILDTHTIEIDWGGGVAGQPAEGTTTITTGGPHPAGTTLIDLGEGLWSFSAEHRFLDDHPTASPEDSFTVTAAVSDDRGGVSGTQSATRGGDVFVTGHSVLLQGGQAGLDVVVLDFLRGAGTDREIARPDYDIGYLRTFDRGAPGGGNFGMVTEADPTSFADEGDLAEFLGSIDLLYVVFALDIDGGTGSEKINSFSGAIRDFFEAGGDIAVESGAGLPTFYDFLPEVVSVTPGALTEGGASSVTAAGAAIGLAGEMVTFQTLNRFTEFADDYAVFEVRGEDVISLGFVSPGVVVRNQPPQIDESTLEATASDTEQMVTVTGTFHDVGSQDTHTVEIDWGEAIDGVAVVTTMTTAGPNQLGDTLEDLGEGHWRFSSSHSYVGTAGTYQIELTVVDDDTGFDSAELGVTVANPPPVLGAIQVDDATNEGGMVTLQGTFFDPGMPNQHTVAIDWGEQAEAVGGMTTLTSGMPLPGNATLLDLGDGNWEFSATHIYADDNPTATPSDIYSIEVTLSDDQSFAVSANVTVVVANVPAEIDSIALDNTTIDEGGTVTVTGTFFDPGVRDTHSVVIDWGETVGQVEQTTTLRTAQPILAGSLLRNLGNGQWSFSASHRYLDDLFSSTPADDREIRVTVADDDSGASTVAETLTVNNVAPLLESLELSETTIDEDGSVVVTGRFTDPGLSDSHTVEIHWGGGSGGQADEGVTTFTTAGIDVRELGPDGSPSIRPRQRFRRLTNLGGGQWSFTANHQYLDDQPSLTRLDSYVITATVTDDDTGTDSRAETLVVRNVAPELEPLELTTAEVAEDGSVVVSGTFTDPRLSDSHTILIHWGGGEGGQPSEGTTQLTTAGTNPAGATLVSLGAGTWSFSAIHQYVDDNPTDSEADSYTILVTVIDDDTGSMSQSATVTVQNIAPVLGSLVLSEEVINPGGRLTVSGTFTDGGPLDTHTVTIDWGSEFASETTITTNGPNPPGTVLRSFSGGLWVFTATHVYSVAETENQNSLTISTNVIDDDRGSDTAQLTVGIVNDVPEVGPLSLSERAIPEGGLLTVSGTFHDAGLADTHVVEIDWGGGTSGQPHEGVTTLRTGGPNPPGTTLTALGDGNWAFSASHQYLDDNPTGTGADEYLLTATVTDNHLGIGASTTTVSVNDVLPDVRIPQLSASTIDENGSVVLTGTFSDVGLLDTHTVVIDWAGGEGQVPEGTTTLTTGGPNPAGTTWVDLGDGNWQFSATHQYLDDNPTSTAADSYSILVTVTDDDTVQGLNVATAQVRNRAPTVDPGTIILESGSAGPAVVGAPVTISASFSDVGRLDTHNVFVNWRDGDTSNTEGSTRVDFTELELLGGGVGSFTVQHVFGASGVYEVVVIVSDDDTGTDEFTLQVTVVDSAGLSVAPDSLQDAALTDFLNASDNGPVRSDGSAGDPRSLAPENAIRPVLSYFGPYRPRNRMAGATGELSQLELPGDEWQELLDELAILGSGGLRSASRVP